MQCPECQAHVKGAACRCGWVVPVAPEIPLPPQIVCDRCRLGAAFCSLKDADGIAVNACRICYPIIAREALEASTPEKVSERRAQWERMRTA